MPKHTFTETTTVNNKVFFEGEVELSDADAKALKAAPGSLKNGKSADTDSADYAESEDDLMRLTKNELLERAKGLDVTEDNNKSEITAKILASK